MFIDYSHGGATDEKEDSGEKLILSRVFVDPKWSAGRFAHLNEDNLIF